MTSIDALVAIHHPVRRRIYDHLYVAGPCRVGVLAAELEQQAGSISHHLRMLERAGVVARASGPVADGRTSWWEVVRTSLSWSVDDFAERPADRERARAAERLNVEHHGTRLRDYQRARHRYEPAWRRAAFSTDTLAQATPAELARLSELLAEATSRWRSEIDVDDGQQREPVFVFSHGVPVPDRARREGLR